MQKISAFAHTEYIENASHPVHDPRYIEAAVREGRDLFARDMPSLIENTRPYDLPVGMLRGLYPDWRPSGFNASLYFQHEQDDPSQVRGD